MSATTKPDYPEMTADEFIVWAMDRPRGERYELFDGRVVAMSPELYGHTVLKSEIARLLGNAIKEAGLPCKALVEGVGVRIDARSTFEPDVFVRCGPSPPSDDLEITDPIVVVEILSRSTALRDRTVKLAGYFGVPSIQHYLLVSGDERRIVHHRRVSPTEFATTIVGDEPIRLDPPGIILSGVFD